MAKVDVSDLLLDPDFIDAISIIRRTTTVNNKGKNVLVESTIETVGSVQPASSKQLQRLPEALRSSDVRAFFIKASIMAEGAGNYPDVLVFNGQRFQVKSVAPWLNYGEGWNEGLCVSENMA